MLLLEQPLDYMTPPPEPGGQGRGFGAFHGMPSANQFDKVAIYDYALPAARIAAHVAAAAQ